MSKKHIIILLILILTTASRTLAADFFPEMGYDPYFSINELTEDRDEDFPVAEDPLVNLIKKRFSEIKTQKIEKQKIKAEQKALKEQAKIERMEQKALDEEQKMQEKEKAEKPKRRGAFWWLDEIDEEENESLLEEKNRKQLEKELMEEEKERQKALELQQKQEDTRTFWQKLGFVQSGANQKNTKKLEENAQIEMTADYMEYFPERYEVEAVGNAKVDFKSRDTVLTANKIIFNYDRNILKANEDVVIISKSATTEGDFVKIDLTRPNGWIENPITKTEDILIKAKEGYIYSDKIEEYDGVAKILKDDVLNIGGRSFGNYMMGSAINPNEKINLSNEAKGVYKLKAKKIIIDSKEEHEEVIVKNADLYIKNRKLASIPSLKIVTNKQLATAETSLPEMGTIKELGAHIGPAILLNVPGGSILKLAPILTYDDDFGIGGIGRFRSQNNVTEFAYGTSNDRFILRGRHKILPGLMFNYSSYANQTEWFLGRRMPKYSSELAYSRTDKVDDLGLTFRQMYTAGVFVDKAPNTDFKDAEGRFRWMTNTTKPIYSYINEEGNIGLKFSLVAQTVATAYTTGDTQGIFRFGPSMASRIGPWNQTITFLQTGIAGRTPFDFDRYRYGRSNLILKESIRVNKYLSLGYLCSIAMNRDVSSDSPFQENRIYVSVGPEYAKFAIGYDVRRQTSMLMVSMLVGTKDSDVEFEKAEVINPQKLKQKKKKSKDKKKDYKKYLKDKESL